MTVSEQALAIQYFLAVLTQADRKDGVTLHVIDVPEVICRGRDQAEAITRGQHALQLALDARAERKSAIPAPTTLDDRLFQRLDADQRRAFKLFYLLPVSVAQPPAELNVSLPDDLVRRIDAAAGSHGRGGWLAAAVREKLARVQDCVGLPDSPAAFTPRPRTSGRRKRPTQ